MPDYLIDLIGVLPVQIMFAYALTKLLHMRSVPVYLVIYISWIVLFTVVRSSLGAEARFFYAVAQMAIPLFMSEGPLGRRVLILVLAHLVLYFMEIPFGLLWTLVTDAPFADYGAVRQHFGAFMFIHVVHFAAVAGGLYLLYRGFRKLSDGSDKAGTQHVVLASLFTLTQIALVMVLVFLPLNGIDDRQFFLISMVLAVLCLVADVLLLVAMRRYARKRYNDERAAMLERQVETYLAKSQQFVEEVEHVARLRHDLGNQVQVIQALAEQGCTEEARMHLGQIRNRVDEQRAASGEVS